MSDIIGTHSVQFDNSFVSFDVVAFSDLSGSLSSSFTFKDIFYQKGFTDSDSSAIATIDVSASDYSNLFKLNVPLWDPSSAIIDTEQVRYFTNASGWSDVSFSHAVVNTNAIFDTHSDQSVKRDFLRSMLKDITGTTRLNSLFKNQNSMLTQISNLDSSFNSEIKDVLGKIEGAGWLTDEDYGVLLDGSQGYTFEGIFRDYSTDPGDLVNASGGVVDLSNSYFSKFNPLRILSSSILGEDDADDTDNIDISGTGLGNSLRRELLIADLSNQVVNFWNSISNEEFTGIDATGDYHKVWVQNTTDASNNGAYVANGEMFSTFLSGYNLYVKEDTSNNTNGSSLITNVVDVSYSFNFIPGDALHLLVKYNPQSSSFSLLNSNPNINSRTYEIKLNMT